ncbi:MAG: hypothetical protein HYX67_14940 [Candidatus Melainabacteria bacterium]|nr:hypothetical protein [Candidatus Melainabacteria bacterium]
MANLVAPDRVGDKCLAQTARPELKDARSYRRRGLASFDSEQFDLALQDLNKAAAMEPKTMTSFDYKLIGDCYLKSLRPADAVAMYNKAMQTAPPKATRCEPRQIVGFRLSRSHRRQTHEVSTGS